ncbi:MAG: sigma 54-interacting transcriptional regulator [Verrucomicrobiota bacterium]
MADRLFVGEAWQRAKRLAEIVYCNPFEDARWEMERECLGDEYREREHYVTPRESQKALAPNLDRLLAMAGEILEKARKRLETKPGVGSDSELSVYENLMHFLLFHECITRFDKMIDDSLRGRGRSNQTDFYLEYRDRLRYFVGVDTRVRFTAEKEALYFAFYFQIRRAWLNTFQYLVGSSPAIMSLRARIWQSSFTRDMRRYQRSLYNRMSDIVTLITGASGTGKELVARAVALSRFVPFDLKKGGFAEDFYAAFYPINLSALSPTLIESELFGHRKGAFTGALQEKNGYFEECGEFGTVFLDEIGETSEEIQVKLLRVLQTRQFQRLGDTRLQGFVGKAMAATNRDLPEEIRKGKFREDFYFRLCADRIQTPHLKQALDGTGGELETMVSHIAYKLAGDEDGDGLTNEVCDWIKKKLGSSYAWPGNFRELEQCVRNILIHGKYEAESLDIPRELDSDLKEAASDGMTANQLLSRYAQEVYRTKGSYEETAKALGIDRRTAMLYVLGVE